jgi:hypothetical protein
MGGAGQFSTLAVATSSVAGGTVFTVRGGVCLDLNADGACTDATAAISDERLKTDIATITNALSIIQKLNGVTYTWNNANEFGFPVGNSKSLGLLAQDVEEVLPELDLVIQTPQGYKMLDYSKLLGVVINAIKEVMDRIEGFAKEFTTEKLCVGTEADRECITKDELRTIKSGGVLSPNPVSGPAQNGSNWSDGSTESADSPSGTATSSEEVSGGTSGTPEESTLSVAEEANSQSLPSETETNSTPVDPQPEVQPETASAPTE